MSTNRAKSLVLVGEGDNWPASERGISESFNTSPLRNGAAIARVSRNQMRDLINEQPNLVDMMVIDSCTAPPWFARRQLADAQDIASALRTQNKSAFTSIITALGPADHEAAAKELAFDQPDPAADVTIAYDRGGPNFNDNDPYARKAMSYGDVAQQIADLLGESTNGQFDHLQPILQHQNAAAIQSVYRRLNKYERRSFWQYWFRNPLKSIWRESVETWAGSQVQEARGGGVF